MTHGRNDPLPVGACTVRTRGKKQKMWLLAPGAALKRRPGWHLFYFVPGGGSTIIFFNARWVGKHFFFIMGGGFEFLFKIVHGGG